MDLSQEMAQVSRWMNANVFPVDLAKRMYERYQTPAATFPQHDQLMAHMWRFARNLDNAPPPSTIVVRSVLNRWLDGWFFTLHPSFEAFNSELQDQITKDIRRQHYTHMFVDKHPFDDALIEVLTDIDNPHAEADVRAYTMFVALLARYMRQRQVSATVPALSTDEALYRVASVLIGITTCQASTGICMSFPQECWGSYRPSPDHVRECRYLVDGDVVRASFYMPVELLPNPWHEESDAFVPPGQIQCAFTITVCPTNLLASVIEVSYTFTTRDLQRYAYGRLPMSVSEFIIQKDHERTRIQQSRKKQEEEQMRGTT